jgi:hypothetical protein
VAVTSTGPGRDTADIEDIEDREDNEDRKDTEDREDTAATGRGGGDRPEEEAAAGNTNEYDEISTII